MKAELKLKIEALKTKPQFKLVGVQKGLTVEERYSLYNLSLQTHERNGSTMTAETIKLLGLKEIKL